MPSLEQLVLSSPVGFMKGCSFINNKADEGEDFLILAKEIFSSVKKGERSSSRKEEGNISSSVLHTTLEYLARSCFSAVPKADSSSVTTALSLCTTLSDEAIEVIVKAVESACEEQENQGEQPSSSHWKLGVAVSSSSCSNLSAPFVSLSYKICDSNGNIRGYAMELSYAEFQEFLAKMKGIAEHMDNL